MSWRPIHEAIKENLLNPFCVTVYGDLTVIRRIKRALGRDLRIVWRITYQNTNTRRRNVTLRFPTGEARDNVLDAIDTIGFRFRVHDEIKD